MNNERLQKLKIVIIGGGNIGQAIAKGFISSGVIKTEQITITDKSKAILDDLVYRGFLVDDSNSNAVKDANIVILAIRPEHLMDVLEEIRDSIKAEQHALVSVATKISTAEIMKAIKKNISVIRIMPNTAIAIGESMTSLTTDSTSKADLDIITELFNLVGETTHIKETEINPSTIISSCGIAFFLRFIRSVAMGGVELGFHSETSIKMAAQAAKGAASLLLNDKIHPEDELDKVTTPAGFTITGLNTMEMNGLSGAIIKGILEAGNKERKNSN